MGGGGNGCGTELLGVTSNKQVTFPGLMLLHLENVTIICVCVCVYLCACVFVCVYTPTKILSTSIYL